MSKYSKHIWHPMAHPTEIAAREPVHIVSGEGVYVTDDRGRKLLDGNSGGLWCVNVGHNRPEMKEAIARQLDELEYFQLFDGVTHPRVTELAAKLVGMAQPEKIKRVFFTSGGSDSVEVSLKLARQFHLVNGEAERKKFISLRNAYHGSHFGASSVNGMDAGFCRRPYEPMVPGNLTVDPPFLYRNPWNCEDPDELSSLCIAQLVDTIEHQAPETIAAVIAEPVLGPAIIAPPKSYWKQLREVCDRYGILLISDEVITGFGRSGSMFGARGWDLVPDMMTTAKGISSAYIPLGAVLIGERMEKVWSANEDARGFISAGYTYSGHPVACAAGIAALDIVEKEKLPENAKVQGDYLLEKLRPFVDKYKSVGDVRGRGLMVTLDLVVDKKTRQPINPADGLGYRIANAGRDFGVMMRPLGPRIILSPPLVFTREHVDELVDGLHKAFSEADQ